MSVKIELYNLVKTAIGTIQEVETFGKFNNQFNTEAEECPFNNPAVFFEFNEVEWKPSQLQTINAQGTQQQQTDRLEFTLHISYWDHKDEEDKYLALLDIVDKVYRVITNIQSENINPIQRITESDDPDHTEPIVWQTTFATMLTEQGIAKNVTGVTTSVNVQTSNS